ncbi:MFS transporter [Ilumatobacter sp.]|uniref:MFS transporter n=1 Tax=Ilumatobacter sp. TaxID=1967498 RepID=UPI003AF5DDEF
MNAKVEALGRRTFASLRFRNYRLYFVSQIISFSGTWMQSIALAWLVLDLTGSGTALGTVLAMQFLPTLLLAPVGGLLADRFEKRRLIMGTQTVAGLLALTLGVLTLSGVVELWMVYVLAAMFGTVTALDNPSRQTFVMEMVGTADVGNAVTLNSVVVNAARVIGPAVAGVVIAVFGVGECFVFNAVSYVAVVIAMFLIRRDELHAAARTPRAPRQVRDGFRYAWSEPILRTTIVMLVLIGTFTFEFSTTLPMLAEFTFGAGPTGLAVMTSLMGAGAVVGGLAVAATGPPTPTRLVAVAVGFGLAVGAIAIMPTIGLVYAVMPFVGVASVAMIAFSNATLQLHSDPTMRGRVMSLFSMALIGSTPIGGPIVGWLGDHTSPRVALAVGAVGAFAAAAYGWSQLLRQQDAAVPMAALEPAT